MGHHLQIVTRAQLFDSNPASSNYRWCNLRYIIELLCASVYSRCWKQAFLPPSGYGEGSARHVIRWISSRSLEEETRPDHLSELAKVAKGRVRLRLCVLSPNATLSTPSASSEASGREACIQDSAFLWSLLTHRYTSLFLSFGPPFPYRVLLFCFQNQNVFSTKAPLN